jgi:transcriptional regulator GlxA family with amidase domain
MDARLIEGGILMGLADDRLAKAITAMNQKPEYPWSLETLAKKAGMSRARFAVQFRRIVGVTPFDYLADWRIAVAQSLLKSGKALKMVAPSVGYASSAALSRAFSERVGMSPTEWLNQSVARADATGTSRPSRM